MSILPLVGHSQQMLDGRPSLEPWLVAPWSLCSLQSMQGDYRSSLGRMSGVPTAMVDCSQSNWASGQWRIGHPLNESSFHLWLCDSQKKMIKAHHRGFDTIATLVAWTVWNEINNRVFNQNSRTWAEIARAMAGETELWQLARAAIPTLVVSADREGSPNLDRD